MKTKRSNRLSIFSKQCRPDKWILALIMMTAVAGLSGCASSEKTSDPELTPVVMQLDWIYNAQFAGFYQAIEQGYFKDVGMEVELRGGPTTPDIVAGTLEEPKISFGSSESNVLLADAAEGADLKIIGTMFQFSPMGWMYLADSGIDDFTDLATKRVGVHADGWRVIKLLLQKQGADVSEFETFECGYEPSVVIDGEGDAMQCYYIDEFVRFEQLKGDRAKVFLAKDYGYEAYSQVMFTHSDTIEEHPEMVTAFLAALKMGWQYAFDHPEETVDLILSKYSPDLDRDHQLRSLAKIEELMIPEPGSLFQPVDPLVLEAGQAHLLKYDLMTEPLAIESILAQSFLP
ncbi:MAG: ABC transporter substrate-binding protein [Verrucomicrobiota bacterium]